jgi:hypothetical protein
LQFHHTHSRKQLQAEIKSPASLELRAGLFCAEKIAVPFGDLFIEWM